MDWLAWVAIIVGVVALRRVGEARGRITVLEREVLSLRAERGVPAAAARPAAGQEPTWAQAPIEVPLAETSDPPTASADAARPTPADFDELPPTSPPRTPRPPRTPPTPPPPRRPTLPKFDVDWERWLGVRGAAVLGGVVLAMAGLYFFQYSIEHGLIPPWLRVTVGTVVGLACIAGSEWKARGRYEATANALVGAGVVILYAAIWAARALYGLIGMELAFGGMIAVTAACTALSYRHASLVISMIGWIGGFATPIMLSTGEPRPIGLFAYLLMLDACLLFVAQRRGWPILALLSLLGTLFYQAAWIAQGMGHEDLLLTLGILAVFAILYAAATRTVPEGAARRQWLVTQGGGLLFPFVFAVYFAAQAELGEHFYPIGMLLALLAGSAGWLARMQQRPWLGLGAASGTTAVFAVWALRAELDASLAWEASISAVVLASIFHAFVEWNRSAPGREGPAPAALLAALGGFLVLAAASVSDGVALWPFLAGWLALAALLERHAAFPERGWLQLAAALAIALGLAVFYGSHGRSADFPDFALYIGVVAGVAVVFQVIALMRAAPGTRSWGEHAAAAFALAMLASLADGIALRQGPAATLGVMSLLGFFGLLAAARLPSGAWVMAATGMTALSHTAWTDRSRELADDAGLIAYAIQLATVGVFTAWPFLVAGRLHTARLAWIAAALAGAVWFPSLREIHETHFGTAAIGVLPIFLGGLSLVAAWRTTQIWTTGEPIRKSNLAWMLAVALGFATVAIPLQLEKEWITIGWALEAAAAAMLWRRLDHAGLKYFALALAVGVTVRLVANDAVLGYYPRPEWRIFNWLLYTYWVSAAALVATAWIARPIELPRVRRWEENLYAWGQPIVAIIASLAAIAVLFVWINLAIADWFATGETLVLSFQRLPARDLTTSIAWAVYALALLAIGVRANNAGARWLSLGLLMVTVVKVFLYDLGELEDLYRVASLLGLAMSLIGVSLAYQRFVIRPERSQPESG